MEQVRPDQKTLDRMEAQERGGQVLLLIGRIVTVLSLCGTLLIPPAFFGIVPGLVLMAWGHFTRPVCLRKQSRGGRR